MDAEACLLIHDRGHTLRVPVEEIVYLKAELKYVTVRTRERCYIYEGSLQALEQAHPLQWVRVHRNALVARHSLRDVVPVGHDEQPSAGRVPDKAGCWQVVLWGVDERLPVSRRQLPLVRDAVGPARGAC